VVARRVAFRLGVVLVLDLYVLVLFFGLVVAADVFLSLRLRHRFSFRPSGELADILAVLTYPRVSV